MSVKVDQKTLREVALSQDEYGTIVNRLGRKPNPVELGSADGLKLFRSVAGNALRVLVS